jgi:NAD(P)H-hydrate epimerase
MDETNRKYVFRVTAESIRLPRRKPETHKGDYGRCLIVAGSVGCTGAPALAARAATRMGAGLVHVGVPERIYNIMAAKLDEEMPFPMPDDGHGRLAANAAGEFLRRAAAADVCLLGPGLGTSPELTEFVSSTIQIVKTPTVLDADGLNAIADDPAVLENAACPLVLTPHEGEFERIGGDLLVGRIEAARAFARSYGCVLVLKGYETVIAAPDGTAYVNSTGGPAMAKGGTGDVLAGMIAALICQRFAPLEAAIDAVYLHGLAGDMCAETLGEYSVTAGDIIRALPAAVKRFIAEQ